MTISTEIGVAVLVNIISISIGIGIFVAKVNSIKDGIVGIKTDVSGFKQEITKDVSEIKTDLKEDIQRLEKKQEKHNCLIERMVVVEQSTKSAHRRLDEHVKK